MDYQDIYYLEKRKHMPMLEPQIKMSLREAFYANIPAGEYNFNSYNYGNGKEFALILKDYCNIFKFTLKYIVALFSFLERRR